MKFLNMDIEPGAKEKFNIEINSEYHIPVWIIRGKQEGNTLVITAGVHGCEYVGIETSKRIFQETDPQELKGSLIILPLINKNGFFNGNKQIVPEDNKNLNREFPGKKDGSLTEQIAYFLETKIYPQADFIIDLHGGDINEDMTPLVFFPIDAEPKIKEKAKAAAMHLPVKYRIPSTAKNGLYSYGVQKGIPGFLLEIGGLGKWNADDIKLCLKCVHGLMGFLEMEAPAPLNIQQQESLVTIYTEAEKDGFWYYEVSPGSKVYANQIIGVLKDLDGEILKTYYADFDGIVLYHTVSLGVKEGDPLVAYCKIG